MQSLLLQDDDGIKSILDLMDRLPDESILDIVELMQLEQVKANTRLWRNKGGVMGLALVDHFNNLRFTLDPACRENWLEDEIVQWGIACVRKHNFETGDTATLDVCLGENDSWRIAMLQRHGFIPEDVRTLRYACPLSEPIVDHAFPSGFVLRCAGGEDEVEALVELHRAAFGTDHMTVEERLAIMRAPQYERKLDLIAPGAGRRSGSLLHLRVKGRRRTGRIHRSHRRAPKLSEPGTGESHRDSRPEKSSSPGGQGRGIGNEQR